MLPKVPQLKDMLPKLPDMKRFQRAYQGPFGKAQGNFGKFAKWAKGSSK